MRVVTPVRKFVLSLAAVMLGCLIGLGAAEVLLRTLWPGGNKYFLWPHHLSVTFKPSTDIVHGVSPEARIQVNSQGIIGAEFAENHAAEYRILTVGGSTTLCIMLDQSKHWGARLGVGLGKTADGRNVWVGNVGRQGFNSRDHLGFMRLAGGQYDLDMIAMLVGANDFMGLLGQGTTYDPDFVLDEDRYYDWLRDRFIQAPLTGSHGGPIYERTALWQLARWVRGMYVNRRKVTMDNNGEWLKTAREHRRAATIVDQLPPLEPALREYQRNLEMIVQEARRRSLRLVLLTQPTFWRESMPPEEEGLVWMGYGPAKPGEDVSWPWWDAPRTVMYSTGALAKGMAAYNQRLLDTCTKLGAECIDLASRIPRTPEMFFDDMHYTERGAQQMANELVPYFESRAPFTKHANGAVRSH